jgi:hypothetical protein
LTGAFCLASWPPNSEFDALRYPWAKSLCGVLARSETSY